MEENEELPINHEEGEVTDNEDLNLEDSIDENEPLITSEDQIDDGSNDDSDDDVIESDLPGDDFSEGFYLDDDGNIEEDENEEADDAPSAEEPKEEQSVPLQIPEPTQEQKTIKKGYIPGTKEFVTEVKEAAKEAVLKELGTDEYDPYDEEHQAWFNVKFNEIANHRRECYEAAQEEIRDSQKQTQRRNEIQAELAKILDSKEKIDAMYKAIRGISHGYHEDMREELLHGKADKLFALAKNVAKKYKDVGQSISSHPHKSAHRSSSSSNSSKPKRDRGYASDLVFGKKW